MAKIASVGLADLPYKLSQDETAKFAKELFQAEFKDIDRLLNVFANGQIDKRQFAKPIEWFQKEHSFSEKNDTYIDCAVKYSKEAIEKCMTSQDFLQKPINYNEIDALFFISTTGLSTPSIDAKLMNHLPFSPHMKRIPIWGLGCAGGAAGVSRAYDYCLAYPDAKVLVVSLELCSLTFQHGDMSKSNLIGTSLFADGAACALIVGEAVNLTEHISHSSLPSIKGVQSTLMPDSEDVMGWDIKNEGLYVVFSKDIPTIIKDWLKPNVEELLQNNQLTFDDITCFVAHPGGKKVIDAYETSLNLKTNQTKITKQILKEYGNMSSATVLYVLERFMKENVIEGSYGLMTALGPGFSSELVLLQWEGIR